MRINILDRYLIREFIRFLFWGVIALALIYILIDLFGELDYYLSQHIKFVVIFKYYLFFAPAAISLLFPSSTLIAVFLVYNQLIRERTLFVIQSAGVSIYRIFAPLLVFGGFLIVGEFLFYELLAIPATRIARRIRKYEIERQAPRAKNRRFNLFMRDLEHRVFYIQEYQAEIVGRKIVAATVKNFTVAQFAPDGSLETRLDGGSVKFVENTWHGENIYIRYFKTHEEEKCERYDTLNLSYFPKPDFFLEELKNIEELQIIELYRYLKDLKKCGFNPAKAEVEFHFRFANPIGVFIIILFSLVLIILLRKSNIMLGLALGLFFSFIYWGLIQVSKALGQILIISPFIAAWLVNFIFLAIDLYLLWFVKRSA
jgi:lipopolysaccharide export system permease protein